MRRAMGWSLVVLWIVVCGVAVPRDVAAERPGDTLSADDQAKEGGRRRRPAEEEDEELTPGDAPIQPVTQPTEVFHEHIRTHMGPVQVCFSQALHRTPGMNGTIDVQFMVTPSGSARAVRVVRSSLGDAQVGQCISAAIQAMQFPAPSGRSEVMVTHTFSYTSPLAAAAQPPVADTPAAASLRNVDEYRQHLIANTDGIRRCYSQALERNPDLSGRIEVRFSVSPAGEVAQVNVTQSTLGDEEADRCVSDAIRAIRFPRNADDATVVVTHSFAFAR